MPQGITIGGLARAAGVHVETIRYYQRLGLVPEPPRPPGGHRRYSRETADQLAFIRRAQQLGFTLAEIKSLRRLSGEGTRRAVREIAELRHSRLSLQAKQLATMSRKLKALLGRSRRYRGKGPDPIIAALEGKTTDAR